MTEGKSSDSPRSAADRDAVVEFQIRAARSFGAALAATVAILFLTTWLLPGNRFSAGPVVILLCSEALLAVGLLLFPWERWGTRSGLPLVFAAACLNALLVKVTGGSVSPYTSFYFLVVLLAATSVPRRMAMLLTAFTALFIEMPLIYQPFGPSLVRYTVINLTIIFVAAYFINLLALDVRSEHTRSNDLQRLVAERDELLGQLRTQVDENAAMLTISAALSHPIGADDVLRAVRETVTSVLDSDCCIVWSRAPEGDLLRGVVLCQHAGEPWERLVRPADGRGAASVLAAEPVVVPDAAASDRLDAVIPRRLGIGAAVILPLRSGDAVVGCLVVGRRAVRPFTERDVRLAGLLAQETWQALQRAELYRELHELAETDGLTGIHNRRFFIEFLKMQTALSRRSGQQLGLVLLDIDHFKEFNDAYGHEVGDTVLARFAQVLRRSSRESDLAARYGGEEFALVLPNSSPSGAEQAAIRLQRLLVAEPMALIDGKPLTVTVSVGVAVFPLHASDPVTLVQCADEALYNAKRAGRNRVCIGTVVAGSD